MGLLRLLVSPHPLVQARAAEAPHAKGHNGFSEVFSILSGSGHTGRTQSQLLQAFKEVPAFQRVVSRVSDSVGAAGWQAFRRPIGQRTKSRRNIIRSQQVVNRRKFVDTLTETEDLVPVESHPALDLLARGNDHHTCAELQSLMNTHLDIIGESMTRLIRGTRSGLPVELFGLVPTWMVEVPTATMDGGTTGRFVVQDPGTSKRTVLEPEEVFWIRRVDPANPYGRGAGMGNALATELSIDEYAARTQERKFQNWGLPSVIIQLTGRDLNEKQLRSIEAKFYQKHGGWERAGRVHFTDNDVKIHQFEQKFADLKLIEQRKYVAEVIRLLYGVPPEILGEVENSNRATIDVADFLYQRLVITPRLNRLETAINRRLLPKFGEEAQDLVLLYDSPVPEDRQFLLDMAKVVPWAFSLNELRELGQLEALEGEAGNRHMVPLGLTLEDPEELATTAERVPADSADGTGSDEGKLIDLEIIDVETVAGPEGYALSADTRSTLLPALAAGLDEEKPDSVSTTLSLSSKGVGEDIAMKADSSVLSDATRSLWEERTEEWMIREAKKLGFAESAQALKDDAAKHAAEFGSKRVNTINKFTQKRIAKVVSQGIDQGDSIADIQGRIKQVFRVASDSRALTIARTEVVRSSSYAAWKGQKIAGVKQRAWVPTFRNTRETHANMAGQVAKIRKKFKSESGATAFHPGGFGVAAEDINCQCTTTPFTGRRMNLEALWKQAVAERRPWEREAEKRFRKAFKLQEVTVLKAAASKLKALDRTERTSTG